MITVSPGRSAGQSMRALQGKAKPDGGHAFARHQISAQNVVSSALAAMRAEKRHQRAWFATGGGIHTALEWLRRLRKVMVLSARSALSGEVQVDETFVGGAKHGVRGRGATGKALVLVAVEVRGSKIGRARLQIIPNAQAASLIEAVALFVEPGSNVVTDGLIGYAGLAECGYTHTVVTSSSTVAGEQPLPKAHRVASLLKRWLLGTHQGAR